MAGYPDPHFSITAASMNNEVPAVGAGPVNRPPPGLIDGAMGSSRNCRRSCSCSSQGSGRQSRHHRAAGASRYRSHHRFRDSVHVPRSARSRSSRWRSHSSSAEDSCSSESPDRRVRRHRSRRSEARPASRPSRWSSLCGGH